MLYFINKIVNLSGYWPAHPNDPQGIRVASGFEFSVCVSVCLSAYLFVLCKFSNIISYDNII